MPRLLALLRSRGLRDAITVGLALVLVYLGVRWERMRADVATSQARAEAAEARERAAVAEAAAARRVAEADARAQAAVAALNQATAGRVAVEAPIIRRRAARASGVSAPPDAEWSAQLMDRERAAGFR